MRTSGALRAARDSTAQRPAHRRAYEVDEVKDIRNKPFVTLRRWCLVAE